MGKGKGKDLRSDPVEIHGAMLNRYTCKSSTWKILAQKGSSNPVRFSNTSDGFSFVEYCPVWPLN
jgi:hypothetical protein